MWVITREPFWFLAIVISLFTSVLCDVSHLRYPNRDRFIPVQHYADEGLAPSARVVAASGPPQRSGVRHYHGQDGKYDSTNDGSGWDIRLSVPGEPERDYPLLNSIPQTSFNCNGKSDGYYADIEARCQVFRVCAITAVEGFFSFLCPNGTLFNQKVLVCDWWMNVECPNFDSEIETNEKIVMKTGPALMEDIRQMIMYPTTVPAPNTNPPMRTSVQVYNPPADMFPLTPNFYKPGGDTSGALTLPTNSFGSPRSGDNNNYNKGSYPIGSTGFGQNPSNPKYEAVIPKNQVSIPVFANLGTQNTADLNFQKAFNAQQAIKVTKQQFTYPSAYDKQYTVPVIPTVNGRPLVVRVPINVAAFDGTENGVPFTVGQEEYAKQVSAFGQTVGGFKNNYQATSGKFVQSQSNGQSVSGGSALTLQNGQKTTNTQYDEAYKSQFSTSAPYTQETQEEKNFKITNSGFYQANRGNLQNSAQKTSVQSKFAQQNAYNQGSSVTGANQYSSKFSKDSTAAVSKGAEEFNQNAQGLSQFGNYKEQVAEQFGNLNAQDVTQKGEYKKEEVSQFGNNQNENLFQRNGQLRTYGTNESGPDNGREYYSQFDTNSGTRPIITEIENQGEFFSIQDGFRRPSNKRPQTTTNDGSTPAIGGNDEQNYNSNGQTEEGNVQQNGLNVNNNGFNTQTNKEIGTAFAKNGQVQNYNSGVQNQRQNQQSVFGQYTATANQAKNNGAYNAGIKTNTQSNQFNSQKYTAGNSQAAGGSFTQKGSTPQGENYNDGGLISVQQQFPFKGPSSPSPFVKSTNGNTANQQTSRFTAFGSTQTTAPQISTQQYNAVKTQGQYVNTNIGSVTKSNINDVRKGSVQSSEYTKQTVKNSPTRSEYNRELSYTQTSGGLGGQSDKYTQGALFSKQGQISGNQQFRTGAVKSVVNKFGATSNTGPVSGEYNREVTYTSNIQTAPVVTSGKFTQEASYSNLNQFSNNYQSGTGSLTSSNNKFVSNENVNGGVKTSQYNIKQNAPVTREYNQQFSYTSQSATPVVNAGQFVSTQQASYSKQGQLSNNYQATTATQNSGINNFKTNSQYTQNNKYSNSQTTSSPFTSFKQTQTYNSQQNPIITSQEQFVTQQKQTNTYSSQPNQSSGSFFGGFAAQNGNRNQESKYFTNSERYNEDQNKNNQAVYQSSYNAGQSAARQIQQSQSSSLNPQNDNEYSGRLSSQSNPLNPQNNDEYSGRLSSQVGFGGSPTPATQENVNYNYENRVAGLSGQINSENGHTNIEVVPAYGFLLNSDREKQEYFTAVSQGLSHIQKIYEAPYKQTAAYTVSSESTGPVVSNYRFNQQSQVSNYQSPNYIPQPVSNFNQYQGDTSGRLISGQGASGNLQPTSNTPSLPVESLGYPHVKPSISFSY